MATPSMWGLMAHHCSLLFPCWSPALTGVDCGVNMSPRSALLWGGSDSRGLGCGVQLSAPQGQGSGLLFTFF